LTNSRAGFYDIHNSGTPTGTWYSLVNMPHSSSNHGHQIAGSFYSAGEIYNRNNNNTTLSAWAKIWNTVNDGSGSGLDADLLDGVNGASYLRSDATDNFTGSRLQFPTLGLSITNDNSGGGYNHYIRGTTTHIVIGTTNGNTFYQNYGNTSGSYNLSGNVTHNGSNAGTKLWGISNDGSGSGLDADLLDGNQASAFCGTGGYTMSGLMVGRVPSTTTVASSNDSGSISIRGNTTKPAVVSFHRGGAYAINFGLSTANKMEMGGWSAGAIKHTWDFAGNYTAVGNITAYSDIRVKENIEVIPEALDKVCQLSGYTFDRTDFVPDAETGVMPETRQTGVIAQEVLKVLPEAVAEMDDGKLTVAYGNMVGLLIEAIKELKTEIEDLKTQLENK
jgi:hypothetical protein